MKDAVLNSEPPFYVTSIATEQDPGGKAVSVPRKLSKSIKTPPPFQNTEYCSILGLGIPGSLN
jgi:hypothetical protein